MRTSKWLFEKIDSFMLRYGSIFYDEESDINRGIVKTLN